jgi:hypothetical protein
MQRPTRSLSLTTALVALVLAGLAAGCATFQYRALQRDFIEAARTDNEAAVDPLAASAADTGAAYASIASALTPERIAGLDPKLRANAWVIRSYSQWRAGQYREAINSADSGLKAPGVGPRDRVLLQLLPALVVDSEMTDRWIEKNRKLNEAEYAPFGKAYAEAYGELGKADDLVDASTAPSTRYYVAYQRWRILSNWSLVIASVDTMTSPARRAALADAEKVVGGPLSRAADAARDRIPDGHPLRQLIRSQGGG